MWQYLGNGQWKNGDTVSTTPPPLNQPFWYQAPDGNWVMPTYEGPDSLTSLPSSVQTTDIPRNNTTVPARQPASDRPWQIRTPVASDSNTGGPPTTTPPPIPPGMPPAALPPTRPVNPRVPTVEGASRPGNIPNSIFWDPDAEAPPGYSEDKWATRFIVNEAQNAKANGPLATVPGVARDVDPYGLEADPNLRIQLPGLGHMNTAKFDPLLLASIQEVAERGIADTGAGKERAQFILDNIGNEEALLRRAMQANVGGKGGGPTNVIDAAGALFDKEAQIREQKARMREAATDSTPRPLPSRAAPTFPAPPPVPDPTAPVLEPVLSDRDRQGQILQQRYEENQAKKVRAGKPPVRRYAGGTVPYPSPFAPIQSGLPKDPVTLQPTRPMPLPQGQIPTSRPIPSMPMPQFPTPAPPPPQTRLPEQPWPVDRLPQTRMPEQPWPVTSTPAPTQGRGVYTGPAFPSPWDPRNRMPVYQAPVVSPYAGVRRSGGYAAYPGPFR